MFKKSYKLRGTIEEEEKIEKERLLEEQRIQKELQQKVGTFF